MQKNKLKLHIYGIHLLNPYKTVVSHLNTKKIAAKIASVNGALVDVSDKYREIASLSMARSF